MERVIYTPPGGPPQGPGPNSAIYGIMGEANIFRMMLDFYKELEKSEIRLTAYRRYRELYPPVLALAALCLAGAGLCWLAGLRVAPA